MPQVKPEVEAFARIKVIGVGGSGKNALNHMINSKVKGVDFISVNTDAQDLHHSLSKKKIHIGKNLTRGLGTGMNPELGKRAVEKTKEEIQEAVKGADMVFIAGELVVVPELVPLLLLLGLQKKSAHSQSSSGNQTILL